MLTSARLINHTWALCQHIRVCIDLQCKAEQACIRSDKIFTNTKCQHCPSYAHDIQTHTPSQRDTSRIDTPATATPFCGWVGAVERLKAERHRLHVSRTMQAQQVLRQWQAAEQAASHSPFQPPGSAAKGSKASSPQKSARQAPRPAGMIDLHAPLLRAVK